MEPFREEGPCPPKHQPEAAIGHRNRPGHHASNCIPGARWDGANVEKVQHLCRVRHARQDQAETEDQTDHELDGDCHCLSSSAAR